MAHLRIRGIALDLTRLNEEILELESVRCSRAVPSATSLGNSGVYLDASLPEIASVDRGIPLAIRARTFASIDAATEVVGDKAPIYGSSLFAIEPTFLRDAKVAAARNWNNSSRERFRGNTEGMPVSSSLDDFSQLDADEHGGTRSRSNSTLDWNAAPAATVPHMSASSAVTRNTSAGLRTPASPAAPPSSSSESQHDSLRHALAALAEAYAAERKRNEILESALSQRLLPPPVPTHPPLAGHAGAAASDAAVAALSATSAVESAVAAIQAMARAAGDSLQSVGRGRRHHVSYDPPAAPAAPQGSGQEQEEEEEEHESALELAEQVAATVQAAARSLPHPHTAPAPTPFLPATPAHASPTPPSLSATPPAHAHPAHAHVEQGPGLQLRPALPDGGASAGGAVVGTARRLVRREAHSASLPLLSPHVRHTAAAAAAPPVPSPTAMPVLQAASAVLSPAPAPAPASPATGQSVAQEETSPPSPPSSPPPRLPEGDRVLLLTVLAQLERLKGELAAQEEAMAVQQALLVQAQERSQALPPASPPALPTATPGQEAREEEVGVTVDSEAAVAAPLSLGSPTAAQVLGQGVDPFYSPAKGAAAPGASSPPLAQEGHSTGSSEGTGMGAGTGAAQEARPPSASSWAETVEAEILKVMAHNPAASSPSSSLHSPAPAPAVPVSPPAPVPVPVVDASPCLTAGSSTPPPAVEAQQAGRGEQKEGDGQDSGVRQLTLLSPAPPVHTSTTSLVDSGAGVGSLAAPHSPPSPRTPPPTLAADPSLHSMPLLQGDSEGTAAATLPVEQPILLVAPSSPQPVPAAAAATSPHQAPEPAAVDAVVDPQPQLAAPAQEEAHAPEEEDAEEPASGAPEQTGAVAMAASPTPSPAPAPAPAPSPPPPHNVQAIRAFVLQLLQGHVFLKHGRRGWPHKRLLWLDATGAELGFRWGPPALGQAVLHEGQQDHWMSLGDVREVVTGRATPVLQRSGTAARAHLYLSIVGSKRSVDLEAESKGERDGAAAMLQLLMAQPGLLQQAMVDLFTSGQWRPAGMEPAGEEE